MISSSEHPLVPRDALHPHVVSPSPAKEDEQAKGVRGLLKEGQQCWLLPQKKKTFFSFDPPSARNPSLTTRPGLHQLLISAVGL